MANSTDILTERMDAILDLYVEEKNREDNKERSQAYFHPSSIGQCPRKTVMERLEVPRPPFPPRIARVFANGHSVHERLTEELRGAGLLFAAEVPLSASDHNMQGHTDGIGFLYIPEVGGIPILHEFKSCNDKSFSWIAGSEKGRAHGADLKHRWQVQLYLYMSGLTYGHILYENKNDQRRKSFIEKKDRDLITNVLLPRVDMINEHVEKKQLPPRDKDHAEWSCFECTYCDVRAVCQEEERLREHNPTEPIDLIELGNSLLLRPDSGELL